MLTAGARQPLQNTLYGSVTHFLAAHMVGSLEPKLWTWDFGDFPRQGTAQVACGCARDQIVGQAELLLVVAKTMELRGRTP